MDTTPTMSRHTSTWCDICFNLNYTIAKSVPESTVPTPPGNCNPMFLFKEPTSSSCDFCKFLTGVIDTFCPNRNDRKLNIILLENGRIEVTFLSNLRSIEVSRLPGGQIGPVYEHIPIKREVEPPRSEGSFDFLKSCLKNCIETHELCRQDLLSAEFPRRLLRIGSPNDGSISLYETPDGFREPYIALSYCWGKTEFLRTKTSNISSLMDGFNLEELPATMQDAVHITQRLGLRYIWIDALCIIQDSEKDWEEQSAKMCSIYEQAYLTIVASSSSSADISFLDHSRPPKFQYRVTNEPDLILTARPEFRNGFHYYALHRDTVRQEPIITRGWTLQESILATRAIYYSTEELQWQCISTRSCECQLPLRDFQAPKFDAKQNQREILEQWKSIVLMYTQRQLTYTKDKLPAMSGICQSIHRRTGWKYLAGLWEDRLIFHLLWHKPAHLYTGDWKCPFSSEYIAPSFSWASLKCGICVDPFYVKPWSVSDSFREDARLVESAILLSGIDQFGRVKPGSSITMRGKLFPIELSGDSWDDVYNYTGIGEEGAIMVDGPLETFCFRGSDNQLQRSVRRSTKDTDGQTIELESGSIAYFFLLAHDAGKVYVLVLGVSPSNHNAYERLGMAPRSGGLYEDFSHLPDETVVIL
ncbi:HET-domain-containing protein [Hypomontagnella submonticulosa]|nr:HET-domain-containing protein [Hypomontagnella submonticulosa]